MFENILSFIALLGVYQCYGVGKIQVDVALVSLVITFVIFGSLGLIFQIVVADAPYSIAVLIVGIDGYGIVDALDGFVHLVIVEMGLCKNFPVSCVIRVDVYQFPEYLNAFFFFFLHVDSLSACFFV